MLENNRSSSLSSLEIVDDQLPPVMLTAEAVASMTAEAMEEELRQLGLTPDLPLPTAIRYISEGKSRSLRSVGYYKYLGRKFYKRLPNVTSIPKHLGDGGLVQRIIAAIMLIPIRYQVNLRIVSIILVLAVALFYADLNGDNKVLKPTGETAINPYGEAGKVSEQKRVHKAQTGADSKPVKDKFLSSEDI